jgi:hypothetical protein
MGAFWAMEESEGLVAGRVEAAAGMRWERVWEWEARSTTRRGRTGMMRPTPRTSRKRVRRMKRKAASRGWGDEGEAGGVGGEEGGDMGRVWLRGVLERTRCAVEKLLWVYVREIALLNIGTG